MVDLAQTMTRQLTIEGRSTGLDDMASKVDKVAGAQTRAAHAGEVLSASQERVNRSTLSVSRQLDAYTRSLDPAAAALAKVERGERLIESARRQGLAVADSALTALANARKRHEELTEAVNDNTKSASLNRSQQMELIHVAKSLADEMAAGANPLRALAVEGGRIGQIFASGDGGVGGTLRAVGGMILPFVVNPITALVVALGVAGTAAYQFQKQQEELERSLNGVGRAAGVTAEELRAIGLKGAAAGGIGAGQGIELAGQYAGAGIAGGNIGTLVADTQRFSRAFGVDMEKAREEIAGIVSDQGLGAFEKRFGAASFAEKELVRGLESSGQLIEAQVEKTRLFNEELEKTKDASWSISRAWDGVKSGLSNAWQSLGNFASGDDRVVSLEKERAREEAQRKAQEAARQADLNRRSQIAGGIIDEQSPQASHLRTLSEQRAALKSFLDSGEALSKLGDRAKDARAAFDKLGVAIELASETPLQRVNRESDLQLRSIRARTAGERAAVEAERAGRSELESSRDPAAAAAAAAAARRAVLAEGGSKAQDLLESTSDAASLIGLSPYARAQKEISNKYSNIRDQYGSSGALEEAEANERRVKDYEMIDAPLKAANQDLDRQNELLRVSTETWGKSAEEIARASKEQELINKYTADGVPLADQLRAQIAKTAQGYGELAKRTDEATKTQQGIIQALDQIRTVSRDALGTFASDLAHGKTAAQALHDTLSKLADRALTNSLDQLSSSLFGKTGQPGGGLLGDSLSQLFSSSSLGQFFHFADGGVMTSRGPLPLNRYAEGGVATSPQLALFGEGSGPEAYVPLKGGAIPVNIRSSQSSGGGGMQPVTVNFHLPAGANGQSFQQSEGQITAMLARAMMNAKRYG